MNHMIKIIGIIYSVLSAFLLPITVFMQFMIIFLFDAPSQGITPYVVAIGIILLPILLIAANIFMWLAITTKDTKRAICYMIVPIGYTILFFFVWFLIDILF